MTREELHNLVWSQPIVDVAKTMGISNVALAKRCRKDNVPVPPRGWWARKRAGQKVTVEPLPKTSAIVHGFFPAWEPGTQPDPFVRNTADEQPIEPRFLPLAEVKSELDGLVGVISEPKALDNPHRIVATLLSQDAKRRPARNPEDPWGSDRKFSSPLQIRRLTVLSAILKELARLGCKIDGRTHAGENFRLQMDSYWLDIRLVAKFPRPEIEPFSGGRFVRQASGVGTLELSIIDLESGERPAKTWDEARGAMDVRVSELVRELLHYAEEDARKRVLRSYKWAVERIEQQRREARRAAEKAEADRIARKEAEAAARIQHLTDGAETLEKADRIRRYVAAVEARNAASPDPMAEADIIAWRDWALAEADRIDPVVSGQFAAKFTTVAGSAALGNGTRPTTGDAR